MSSGILRPTVKRLLALGGLRLVRIQRGTRRVGRTVSRALPRRPARSLLP